MNWTELYFKLQAIEKIAGAAVGLVAFGAICFLIFLAASDDWRSKKRGKK